MKRVIFRILTIVFVVMFLVSAGFLIDYFLESRKQKNQYDELANMVDQALKEQGGQQQQSGNNSSDNNGNSGDSSNNGTTSKPLPTHLNVVHPTTGETLSILREYSMLFEINTDMVGWIKIPGTKISYPVMQTPDNPNYYLDRDFYKKSSIHGAIYANETADLSLPSDNITLYGHKMKDGSMFAELLNYKQRQYFDEHPIVHFDTLSEHHTYQIIAVFPTTANLDKGFTYHTFVDSNVISFLDFIEQCKALSVYDTGVTAEYGDKLLTLSTCDHSIDNGRFVVVAKRVS